MMLAYVKLLYNGTQGADLDDFMLKLENCNHLATFY